MMSVSTKSYSAWSTHLVSLTVDMEGKDTSQQDTQNKRENTQQNQNSKTGVEVVNEQRTQSP